MKQGDAIQLAREEDIQCHPSATMNTRLVAAAITSGILPVSKGFYADTVETVRGKPKRDVTWCLRGEATAHFKPDFKEETIDFHEFQRRWNDLDWQVENPSHPITYMAEMFRKHSAFVDKIKTLEPMLLIRKGNRTAIVPSGDSPEEVAERDEILAKF